MRTRRVIVNWRDPQSAAMVPVAQLLARPELGPTDERYEFQYVQGVRRALELGFQPFLAFPRLDCAYVGTELFPFFRNRVLPSTRADYPGYVEALGLSRESANVIDLLGRSEGRRHTDRIETVLAAERDPITGGYLTRFLLRGVRYEQEAEAVIRGLSPGAQLTAVLEPGNPKNPRARKLVWGHSVLGYVADYLLGDLDGLEAANATLTFTVERVNPAPHPAHHRVLVRLQAPWPRGFEPFSGPEFRPYSAGEDPALPRVG